MLKFSKKLAFLTFTIALSFGVISVSHAGRLDKQEACVKECEKTNTECGSGDPSEQKACKKSFLQCKFKCLQ